MATWIPVLVRTEHYQAVARVIEQLEADHPEESGSGILIDAGDLRTVVSANPPHPSGLESRPSWNPRDLARLAAGSTVTTQRWSLAMDVCAENPGTFFPTSEIADRSGMTVVEWRDAPRKISRHLKIHFPDVPKDSSGHALWPLLAKTQPENPGEVSWAITNEMASLWREVRGQMGLA